MSNKIIQNNDTWKQVTKEELKKFIKSYPIKLIYDFYMDWDSWNDCRNNRKWPESMVAMAYEMYNQNIYKIREDYLNEK